MTPILFTLATFLAATAAGFLGSILGLGGGIVIVPVLTLLLGVDIRYAIGASIVSVIATSTAASAAYVRDHLTNLRVAMFLELATTAGALSGALLAGYIPAAGLYLVFGLVLIYAALAMSRPPREHVNQPAKPSSWAVRLNLHGTYRDPGSGVVTAYRVERARLGFGISYFAGAISGLLGVGGGIIKVPAMTLVMHMPLKVATATSNFMIGVTAAASAGVYFARGDINPFIAGPVAVGVLLGATLGARSLGRLSNQFIKFFFVLILLYVSLEMLHKAYSLWR